MKKRQRVILLSSLLLASSLALTINYAFCSPFIRDNAGSINIGITGIALGNEDYYVFFGDSKEQALEKGEDGKYTTSIGVASAGNYTYKITDKFGNPKYESKSFNLGITGTFNLSFTAASDASEITNPSLTYSFSLVDEGNAFGTSSDALPYCSFSSAVVNPTDFYIVGDIASKPEGVTGSWDKESGVRMTTNPDNTSDLGMVQHVYLTAADQFKITCYYRNDSGKEINDNAWYGHSNIIDDKSNFSSDSDNNIVVNSGASGYYDIYLSSNSTTKAFEITINKSESQEAEPIKIQAASFDSDTNTTTYTLDATKYASESTYISFSDNGNTKGTQSIAVSQLITTNSTLTMKKYLYLDVSEELGNGGWYNDSATFKALISDTEYTMTAYGTNFYQLSTPIPTSVTSFEFLRCNPDETDANNRIWNRTGTINNTTNCIFKITGWDNSSVASSYSGAPEFIVEKNS